MRTNKRLQLEQLDRKIKLFSGAEGVIIPGKGWINSIRVSLNMTLEQLGARLNVTKQGAKKMEQSESTGSISLKSLKEAAEALDLKLVYALVPRAGSLEQLINSRAEALARKIVLRTSHNMKLENQENTEEQINKAIDDLKDELKREMNKALWD